MTPVPLILLAEDNEDEAFLTRLAFQKARVLNRLEVVNSGAAAIAYLEGCEPFNDRTKYPFPGLLLLDLRMPGMDGFDVLRHIQARPHLRQLRVVVLTCSSDVRDMNEAYRLGAAGFVIKPADFLRLVEFSEAIAGYWLWFSESPGTNPPAPLPSADILGFSAAPASSLPLAAPPVPA